MASTQKQSPSSQAEWVRQQYSPWLSLHMLLKDHKKLVTTNLLEHLLDKGPLPLENHNSPTTPTAPAPAPAKISRHLIQRLHFGYYGDRRVLSESIVRYLTARARLEMGYFIIRGRAFWQVCEDDLKEGPEDLNKVREKIRHERLLATREDGLASPSTPPSLTLQGSSDSSRGSSYDPSQRWNPFELAPSMMDGPEDKIGAAGAEYLQKITRAHQRCEEREEKLLMLEAARFWERQPVESREHEETLKQKEQELKKVDPHSSKVAAIQWRRAALIYSTQSEVESDPASAPPSPFLNRLSDHCWMERLQWPHGKVEDNRRMVQDDARLFQVASGIFATLATCPKKWRRKPTIADGPLGISTSTMKWLVEDYGYLPLPEDDRDRKAHYLGGNRGQQGETDLVFPSDGSHVVNKKGRKGPGTSIWYFYDLQRLEVMIVYLIFKAAHVLDWMFERGFQIALQAPGSDLEQSDSRDNGGSSLGVSPAWVLLCCLPDGHSMLRHVLRPLSSWAIAKTIKEQLLGMGDKPKRIEFSRQDYANVLKHIAPAKLKDSIGILTGLGMDITVVQDRLTEILQIPTGPYPVDIEQSVLEDLFGTLNVEWTIGHGSACVHQMLKSLPFAGTFNWESSPPSIANSLSQESLEPENDSLFVTDDLGDSGTESTYGSNSTLTTLTGGMDVCPQCPPLSSQKSPVDVVDEAMRDNFEIQMDPDDFKDWHWKEAFEDTLRNLHNQSLTIHPQVSQWILDTLDAGEQGFGICFDHVLLEALSRILNWNDIQIQRLQNWAQMQEDDVRLKRSLKNSQWESIKRQLVIVQKDYDLDESSSMNARRKDEERIYLDLEWTTGGQVAMGTTNLVASMPNGSDMIRLDDEGHLLLDNGNISPELLLCDYRVAGDIASLKINEKVFDCLERGAKVEEKHILWVALGLATVSFRGMAGVIRCFPAFSSLKVHSQAEKRNGDRGVGRSVIPVRIACAPEAYQLVWLLVLAFVRQTIEEEENHPLEAPSAYPASTSNQGLQLSSPPASPPLLSSPMILPPLTCGAVVAALQALLMHRLGRDGLLMVDILSEIEDDLEEYLERETEL